MSTPREDTPDGVEKWALRLHLAARDGRRCFYCRMPFLTDKQLYKKGTLDHYIPYSLWRGWWARNLVLACRDCNQAKDNALPVTVAVLLLQYAEQNSGWRPVTLPAAGLHTDDLETAA